MSGEHFTVNRFDGLDRQMLERFAQDKRLKSAAFFLIRRFAVLAAVSGSMMGQPLISDPIEIASACLFYICRNDAFVDGNKRTALAACLVFLEGNGFLADRKLPINDWEQFVLDVAASQLDRAATTRRLRKLLKPRARSVLRGKLLKRSRRA